MTTALANKSYVRAEVKDITDSQSPNGEFEVILSMPTLDRDGEILDARCFAPLPSDIPFHVFHDHREPIGRAVPRYVGDILKAKGFYASTARAQEIRTLVAEGVIRHTSVGFLAPTRKTIDGVTHITSGELLEGSFVSVSSNREAEVLMAKSHFRRSSDDMTVRQARRAATDALLFLAQLTLDEAKAVDRRRADTTLADAKRFLRSLDRRSY